MANTVILAAAAAVVGYALGCIRSLARFHKPARSRR